ncbi:MAG: hypothetical protein IJE49_05565 [Agathobacter sp.]|nr:hypothetical protein [Agathobacter sp.]
MGKEQKKRSKQGKKESVNTFKLNEMKIDSKTLTEAIVEAYQIIEKKKAEQEIELEKNAKKEWQEILGQKVYPKDEKWYLKIIHIAINNVVAMWKLLFLKSKNVRGLRATYALMQSALVEIFKLYKWTLYVIAAVIFCSIFQNGTNIIVRIVIAVGIWMFARLFRIASFEIDKMQDENLLIAIFSGCISFVAMIVAIIALFI